jgi:hypothetical protein
MNNIAKSLKIFFSRTISARGEQKIEQKIVLTRYRKNTQGIQNSVIFDLNFKVKPRLIY